MARRTTTVKTHHKMKRNAFTIVELLILCFIITALTTGLVKFLNAINEHIERKARPAEEALAKNYAEIEAIRISIDALVKALNKQPQAKQP